MRLSQRLLQLLLLLVFVLIQGCASVGGTGASRLKNSSDPWFGQDKYYHALTSAAIARLAAKRAERNSSNPCAPLVVGLGVSLSAGTAKELYDKNVRKTIFSWRDMVWNAVGALLGSLSVSTC